MSAEQRPMRPLIAGRGQVGQDSAGWSMTLPGQQAGERAVYSNAQVCDYLDGDGFAPHVHLIHRPPLRLSLTAWTTAPASALAGTAGFGLWNHMSAREGTGARLPRAVWFFHAAPPSNMALAQGVPGLGWKCATIDALNRRAMALLPLAPPAILLFQSRRLRNRLYPKVQRALKIDEHPLDDSMLAEPHRYVIDWLPQRVEFRIDDALVFATDRSPAGPLGFVAWLDTRYAIVTPHGRFGYGVTHVGQEQALRITDLRLERLSD